MRKIVITDRAKLKIAQLLEYLESKWNKKVKNKFADKLYKNIQLIANDPKMFPVSENNKRVTKCVVSKQ